jgi:nitronate monooxygenase
MIVASGASDIVYSNLFTGVHGNYLRGSIEAAGYNADDLPDSDPTAMSFASGDKPGAKAWKEIWGSGQGIGAVTGRHAARDLVARLKGEYDEGLRELAARLGQPALAQ